MNDTSRKNQIAEACFTARQMMEHCKLEDAEATYQQAHGLLWAATLNLVKDEEDGEPIIAANEFIRMANSAIQLSGKLNLCQTCEMLYRCDGSNEWDAVAIRALRHRLYELADAGRADGIIRAMHMWHANHGSTTVACF